MPLSSPLILLLVICSPIFAAKIFSINATFKRNKDNHQVWDLSNASNGKAVILGPDKVLSLNFCLRRSTNVMVNSFRFSNGNNSEVVVVKIDHTTVGTFQTPLHMNHDWNNFLSTIPFPGVPLLSIGWHQVTVMFNGTADGIAVDKIDLNIDDDDLTTDIFTCELSCIPNQNYNVRSNDAVMFNGSADGIAVDKIDLNIDDDDLTTDIFTCELSCIPNQNYNVRSNDAVTESSFIVQESYKTACPEVDNINVPIFNPSVQTYEITAVLPRYRTFSNWRFENTTGCPHLDPQYWSFRNIALTQATRDVIRIEKASLYFSEGKDRFSKMSLMMIIQFNLEGRSMGMIDSEMGTILRIKFKNLSTNVRLTMRYKGRTSTVSDPDVKLLTPRKLETEWNTRDFSWTSQDYNIIFLYIDTNSSKPIELEYMYLERRPMLADQTQTIHKGDDVIIEAIFSDFWWLRPDTLTVHLPNGEIYNNVSYFRIYRPIPWNSGYAQVFVLYQDGNARLLPVPPEGVDWIPFGSSVIIGQTDPTVVRPFASITHAYIDIERLTISVRYRDGGSAKLTLVSSLTETRVIVSDIYMARNPIEFPFTTFRSMYVAEGNNDVDHVSINGMYPVHIMKDFGTMMGRSFVFHRKCMSRHLNLSPDIYIDVRKTANTVAAVPLVETNLFQSLLQRIQNHRFRLWTPRLRN